MRGSRFLLLAGLALSLAAPAAGADGPYEVGVLFWHDSENDLRAFEGVKDGFRIAGMDVEIDVRNVREDAELARRVLEGFEAEGKDLVYAFGTEAALRAKEATSRVPVVFTAVTNPVASFVVDSWEGSGTNLCGNSNRIAPADLFRVFQHAFPGLARLGVVLNPANKVSMEELADARRYFEAASEMALRLDEEGIAGPEGLERAVERVLDRGAQALWIPIDIDVYRHLDRVAAITTPRGVPLLSSQGSAVESHAIVSVAVNYRALGRMSVVFAKRILVDGVPPGGMAVGRMRSFEVSVNLAAARRAGFTVPLPLVATADRILDPEGPGGGLR